MPFDYPENLAPYYGRSFRRTTLGVVRRRLNDGGGSVFVKPAERRKRFTGLVLGGPEDLWRVASVGDNVRVVCSDVVTWLTEWRVFVHGGEVVGVEHYDGDTALRPDADVVEAVVTALRATCPAGFAIDVGVIGETGRTAVVEVNDGFALGRYGLDPDAYVDLLVARWRELLA